MNDLKTIRTDVVGSLLRPAALKDARTRFDDGQISADDLRELEDDAVRDAVRLQEDAGLDVVSDGEMRRLNFQDSFGAAVEGFDANRSTLKVYRAAGRRLGAIAALGDSETAGSRNGGFASSSDQGSAAPVTQCSARGIPLRQYGCAKAGQSVADRPRPHFTAL